MDEAAKLHTLIGRNVRGGRFIQRSLPAGDLMASEERKYAGMMAQNSYTGGSPHERSYA